MNKLVKLLTERDSMTEDEAEEIIAETREEMIETGSDEPMYDMLGVEPDYIFDVI